MRALSMSLLMLHKQCYPIFFLISGLLSWLIACVQQYSSRPVYDISHVCNKIAVKRNCIQFQEHNSNFVTVTVSLTMSTTMGLCNSREMSHKISGDQKIRGHADYRNNEFLTAPSLARMYR
jgi:hypothetical protein